MKREATSRPLVAIACGGTGGHLFPGLAVADELRRRGCDVHLLVSPKEVDRVAMQSRPELSFVTLPAVGLSRGRLPGFAIGFWKAYRAARTLFRNRLPQGVLAMGGFTAAPAILAGKRAGAAAFLHESNSVPGRANRWLARWVDQAYVGFEMAAARLRCREVVTTGTPVRPGFKPRDPTVDRATLGLDADRPVLLIMGGSQGASAINRLAIEALPRLKTAIPELQYVHLSGAADEAEVRAAYARHRLAAGVWAFLAEMEMAMGAATLAISRAGASSLAEIAAVRLPALLVPYPFAADNHQFFNAQAFFKSGAALMQVQSETNSSLLAERLVALLNDERHRTAMSDALARWSAPQAAPAIAEHLLARLQELGLVPSSHSGTRSSLLALALPVV